MKTCSVVVTTINDGTFLDHYVEKAKQEHCLEQTSFWVIPDKKTNPKLFSDCQTLRQKGARIRVPTVGEQDEYLRRLGDISRIIPYNSDNRRNIGYLMALESGSDFLISIDDDNYCRPGEAFFSQHQVVTGEPLELDTINCANGWLNLCELMEMDTVRVYPRGYPYFARKDNNPKTVSRQTGTVHINAGLWLREPDVDAMTWLVNPPHSLSFKGVSYGLGPEAWSPINTQNTGLNRQAVSAYYFVRMGHSIGGLTIDRFGDIFSGYFVQKCARHLGYQIRAGSPVADHIRNRHNYLKDVTQEFACIWILEDLLAWLKEAPLTGSNYEETYLALAAAIEDQTEKFSGAIWTPETKKYFHEMADCMRIWIATINKIK